MLYLIYHTDQRGDLEEQNHLMVLKAASVTALNFPVSMFGVMSL